MPRKGLAILVGRTRLCDLFLQNVYRIHFVNGDYDAELPVTSITTGSPFLPLEMVIDADTHAVFVIAIASFVEVGDINVRCEMVVNFVAQGDRMLIVFR